MTSELIRTIIISGAAVLAVIIIVLLIKKFIKAIIALVLIAAVLLGAFLGLRALDNKTNLRKNVASVDEAFAVMTVRRTDFDIRSIQANCGGEDIGITVIVDAATESSAEKTQTLLSDVREVLLQKDRYNDICSAFVTEGRLPKKLRVGLKFNKLDIAYYEAGRTASNDLSDPDGMYADFSLVLETGELLPEIG